MSRTRIYPPSTVYGENTYTSLYTQPGRNIGHSVWHGGNTADRYICNYTAWQGSNISRRPGISTYIIFICSRFCAHNREASERVYMSCGPLKLHTVHHAQNKPTRQQHVHGLMGKKQGNRFYPRLDLPHGQFEITTVLQPAPPPSTTCTNLYSSYD